MCEGRGRTVMVRSIGGGGCSGVDFGVVEFLLLLLSVGERWVEGGQVVIEFSVYEVYRAMGGGGGYGYRWIREGVERLKEWQRVEVYCSGERKEYSFPFASFIVYHSDPERYTVYLSPPMSVLLAFDMKVKSEHVFEILDAYFSLPLTLRRLAMYLLSHQPFTLSFRTAAKIACVSPKNTSRFISALKKHTHHLSILGIHPDYKNSCIHTRPTRTCTEPPSPLLHTILSSTTPPPSQVLPP